MGFGSAVLSYLADASIRALCLGLVVCAALAAMRRRSAASRHAVWTALLCAMLLLPVLAALLPALPVRVLPAKFEVAAPLAVKAPAVQGAAGRTLPPAPAPREQPGFGWRDVVVAVYAAGLLIFGARLLFGYLFVARLVRGSVPVADPRALALAGGYRLIESSWISVPMTAGWLRPRILLPTGWPDWEDGKLEAVLVHELSHVGRRDWLVALAAGLNKAIFWFHPLAWWLEKKLAALAEEACDDSSLAAFDDREQYARALLDMAAAVRSDQGRLVWEAMAMARPSEVQRRIERVLDRSRAISRGLTKRGWAALLLAGFPLLYGAATLNPLPQQAPEPTQSPFLVNMAEGNRLTPAEAQQLESRLQADPEDLAARGRLIAYYLKTGANDLRLGHLFWLIEHHPESEIAGFNAISISPDTPAMNSANDYERAKALWLDHTRLRGDDPRVLDNAARFFSQPGPDLAIGEELLKRLRLSDPFNTAWAERLASLYTMVIRADVPGSRFRPMADPAMVERIKSDLEASNDGLLVMMTATQLTGVTRGRPELAPAFEFGQRLMERARQLGGPGGTIRAVPRVTEGDRFQTAPAGGPGIGVVGGVPGGLGGGPPRGVVGGVPGGGAAGRSIALVKRVAPVYPPLAKQARIQGTARFDVVIGADGSVQNITVGSGHPLLVPAAMEALRQWQYEPQPEAVRTTVDINFTLPSELGATAGDTKARAPMRIRVGGNVQQSKLVRQVPPVYPPLAKQARIQGAVRLMITLGADGTVKDAALVAGHPLLVSAAYDAVKQWIYQPTLLNGQPVEVVTQVDVNFTLSE